MEQQFDYDMHMHTYYSDGEWSPEKMVEYQKSQGMKVIAITDHDGVNGVKEAQEAAARIGGITVIPGIEFSADDENSNVSVHMLGYEIDVTNPALLEASKFVLEARERRNAALLAVLDGMGYPLEAAELPVNVHHTYIGKPNIAMAMLRNGYIKEYKDAFSNDILGCMACRHVKKEKLTIRRAMDVIHGAGGYTVLAHPAKIKHLGERGSEEFWMNLDGFVEKLTAYGLEGIECYHRDHAAEEAARLVKMAEKYSLRISRGSDFHGPHGEPGEE